MKRHLGINKLLILLAAGLVGACAKNTEVEPFNKALDIDSKSAFFDVLSSMARTSRAVELAGQTAPASAEAADAHPADQVLNPEDALNKMADSLKGAGCSLDYKRDQDPLKPATAFVFEFDQAKAEGRDCPVSMKIDSKKTKGFAEHEVENGMAVASEVAYAVSNPEFKKLNDVDSFNLKGDFSSKFENTKSIRKRILRWNGRMTLSGTIHSQKYGDLKYTQQIYYTGQGPDTKNWRSNLELSIEIEFPEFKASLRTVQQEHGNSAVPGPYYLNGEEVSASYAMGLIASELPIRIKAQ